MPQTTEVFKQWRPFIVSTARKVSGKYHLEYEEVESQAYILFMEAIQKNKDKNSDRLFYAVDCQQEKDFFFF